ncbi:MAG: hypothetical protein JWM82_1416 [Myxococcales bacterium]|nr:hypothetical protein [Myxococcales bacterium]
MIRPVRRFVFAAALLWVGLCLVSPARAQPTGGSARARVSVQPFNSTVRGKPGGELGPALREQIARLLKARGYHVVTTLPRVGGTGQYLELAKDNRLAAFVTADLEEGRHHTSVTFLLWDGATGSVQGRWSASASAKKLPKAIAKGFWKYFGPRFEGVQPPPSDELEPAPPMYVNAGTPLD